MTRFDTDEDLHTIMQYKRQEARSRGVPPILVTVDIDFLARVHGDNAKMLGALLLYSILSKVN